MNLVDEINNDEMITKGKSNVLDKLLFKLLDGRNYKDLNIDERIKMDYLMRESLKLNNIAKT